MPKPETNPSSVKKSLDLIFLNGVVASAVGGFTLEYFTPFALLLGATARQIGILSALPNLAASLIQFKSPDITDWIRSRKAVVRTFVLFQGLSLLPAAAAAAAGGFNIWAFIGLVVVFTCCAALTIPAWGSMVSDLIDNRRRGDIIGRWSRTFSFVTAGTALLGGVILQQAKKWNVFYGFAVLFGSVTLLRVLSWVILRRVEEPSLVQRKEDRFSVFQFLARVRESNFTKFVLFSAVMNFAVNIGSPFFSVLLLKELKFGYLVYISIQLVATLTALLTIRRWGLHADRTGNLKVIKFTAPLIGGVSLLWTINHHPIFLCFAQVFSGFVWAGFNLCMGNFIYDAVTPEKRTRCLAYFNAFNGLGLCAGALLGGFILPYLPPFLGYRLSTLFLISAVLRTAIGLVMPPRLKEVRPVEKMDSYCLFFSMLGVKPVPGTERKGL